MLQTPACGQLNRENQFHLLSSFAPEDLVWRGRFSCPLRRQPVYSPHLRLMPVLIRGHFSPSRFPRRRHLSRQTAIGSAPSLTGHAAAYRWRSLPRIRRHGVSCPKGGSSDGWVMAVQVNPLGPHLFGSLLVSQYICILSTFSRVWVGRVRLPTLLVVS